MYTNEYIAMQLHKLRETEVKDMRHNRAIREAINEQRRDILRGRKTRNNDK